MYRLGTALVVRLPRRHVAARLARHEHAWLGVLANNLPIPVPVPVRVGTPSDRYPWPWSIVPWIPGDPADQAPPSADQAGAFARFLRALHRPAPPNAPTNPVRGGSLGERASAVEERLIRLRTVSAVFTPRLQKVWNDALAAPRARESCWLHGDLHARNVLVRNGVITGVIDWADLTAGDVATDLASVWMLFSDSRAPVGSAVVVPDVGRPPGSREGVGRALWRRAARHRSRRRSATRGDGSRHAPSTRQGLRAGHVTRDTAPPVTGYYLALGTSSVSIRSPSRVKPTEAGSPTLSRSRAKV